MSSLAKNSTKFYKRVRWNFSMEHIYEEKSCRRDQFFPSWRRKKSRKEKKHTYTITQSVFYIHTITIAYFMKQGTPLKQGVKKIYKKNKIIIKKYVAAGRKYSELVAIAIFCSPVHSKI